MRVSGIFTVLLFCFFRNGVLFGQLDIAIVADHHTSDIFPYFTKSGLGNPEETGDLYVMEIYNSSQKELTVLCKFDRYDTVEFGTGVTVLRTYSALKKYKVFEIRLPPGSADKRSVVRLRRDGTLRMNPRLINGKYIFFIRMFEDYQSQLYGFRSSMGLLYMLVFINFMNFGAFLITRRKDYLFYGLYTLSVFLYILVLFVIYPYLFIEDKDIFSHLHLFHKIIQPFFYIFYCFFAQHFLQTKERFLSLHRLLNQFILFSFGTIFIVLLCYLLHVGITEILFTIYRITAVQATPIPSVKALP